MYILYVHIHLLQITIGIIIVIHLNSRTRRARTRGRDDDVSDVFVNTRRRSALLGSRSYTARIRQSQSVLAHNFTGVEHQLRPLAVGVLRRVRGKRFSRPVLSRELPDRYRGIKRCSKRGSRECVNTVSIQIVARSEQCENGRRGERE